MGRYLLCYKTKQPSLGWQCNLKSEWTTVLWIETPEMLRTFPFLWQLTVFMFSHSTNDCEQSEASAVVTCQAQTHLHSFHVFHWEIHPFTKWLSDKLGVQALMEIKLPHHWVTQKWVSKQLQPKEPEGVVFWGLWVELDCLLFLRTL